MYIYDRKLSGAQSVLGQLAIEKSLRLHGSGTDNTRAHEVRRLSAANEELPRWLQEGVRRGRWTKQTASGLWALRKISQG